MAHGQRTPFQIYESILQTLNTTSERINLIESDQKLIAQGWTIHFAVDPHDIYDFCFPFSNYTLRHLRPSRIEEMSRVQNGRYEVMFNLSTKPILLEEYEQELGSILRWALSSQSIHGDDETIDRYLQAFQINPSDKSQEAREVLENLTDRDISSMIAIVTGMGAIGVKRLDQLINQRLVRNIPGWDRGRVSLARRMDVVSHIEQKFVELVSTPSNPDGSVVDVQTRSDLVRFSEAKVKRNNRRDAAALDQVLQVNSICNKQKHLVLYFSSARKSLALDRMEELKHLFPIIENSPYHIVRTASDLFVYMIYRGRTGEQKETPAAIVERLSDLANLLTEVEGIRDSFKVVSEECQQCKRNDLDARPCRFVSLCEGVRKTGEVIEKRQYTNVNLSLEKRLAAAVEKTQDHAPQRYGKILGALSEILNEKRRGRPKDQEMELVLRTSLNKANFVSALMKNPRRPGYKGVSCYMNYYPTCLHINDAKLKKIVKRVVDILRTWKEERFEQVVGEYLELDSQWMENSESELVRCFLYFVMYRFGRAEEIAESLSSEDSPTDANVKREFWYLACFIMWRQGKFEQAIKRATQAIERYPGDGRFPHCRSLITQSWLETEGGEQSRSFQDVIDDTNAAITCFTKERNKLMVAVCHNNAAYYFSDLDVNHINIALAEQHLEQLTKRIPETRWDPTFPEFFHTKGSVCYAKFLLHPSPSNSAPLHEAYRSAKKAFDLDPEKEQHKNLITVVGNAYRMLKMDVPKL